MKGIVLTWNATWGKQPAAREVPISRAHRGGGGGGNGEEAQGMGKGRPRLAGHARGALGGETNELSARRAATSAAGTSTSPKERGRPGQGAHRRALRQEAVPDVVAEGGYGRQVTRSRRPQPHRRTTCSAGATATQSCMRPGSTTARRSPSSRPGHGARLPQPLGAAGRRRRRTCPGTRAAITTVMLQPGGQPRRRPLGPSSTRRPDFHST